MNELQIKEKIFGDIISLFVDNNQINEEYISNIDDYCNIIAAYEYFIENYQVKSLRESYVDLKSNSENHNLLVLETVIEFFVNESIGSAVSSIYNRGLRKSETKYNKYTDKAFDSRQKASKSGIIGKLYHTAKANAQQNKANKAATKYHSILDKKNSLQKRVDNSLPVKAVNTVGKVLTSPIRTVGNIAGRLS